MQWSIQELLECGFGQKERRRAAPKNEVKDPKTNSVSGWDMQAMGRGPSGSVHVHSVPSISRLANVSPNDCVKSPVLPSSNCLVTIFPDKTKGRECSTGTLVFLAPRCRSASYITITRWLPASFQASRTNGKLVVLELASFYPGVGVSDSMVFQPIIDSYLPCVSMF